MRFSMWLWPYARWGGFDGMGRAARRIEELGFDSVTVSDHTLAPAGRQGDALGTEWPDWAVTSTYLASATDALRIVACVAVPYRHPVVTARQVATVDQVSRGRFTLAACVGWWRREFDMLGVPYQQRGAVMDDHLDAIRTLWVEELPTVATEYTSISGVVFEPKCWQDPHVPIWIAGGASRRVLERLWRIGDGWMPMGDDRPDALAHTIAAIKAGAAERGRDPEDLAFRYTVGIGEAERTLTSLSTAIADANRGGIVSTDPSATPRFSGRAEEVAEDIARYAAAGFNELAINPAGESYGECMDRIDWFAAEVMPLVQVSHSPRPRQRAPHGA